MPRELLATYHSTNSTYLQYIDGWAKKCPESQETQLENAVYMSTTDANTVLEKSSSIGGKGIIGLIENQSTRRYSPIGGRIVSTKRHEDGIDIQRSGVITRIEQSDSDPQGKILL